MDRNPGYIVESRSIQLPLPPNGKPSPSLPQWFPFRLPCLSCSHKHKQSVPSSCHGAEAAEVLVSTDRSKSKCQFAAGKSLGWPCDLEADAQKYVRSTVLSQSVFRVSDYINIFSCKGPKTLPPQLCGKKMRHKMRLRHETRNPISILNLGGSHPILQCMGKTMP